MSTALGSGGTALEDGEIFDESERSPASACQPEAGGEWEISGQKRKKKASAARLAKKQRKLVDAGKGSRRDFFDVYGQDARAEIVIQEPESADVNLKLQDVQGLLLWLLADALRPTWAFVKNKPLVEKVVLLFLPGLDGPLYRARPELFPNLRRICPTYRNISAPSPVADVAKSASTLLTVPVSKKKWQKQKQEAKQDGKSPPPSARAAGSTASCGPALGGRGLFDEGLAFLQSSCSPSTPPPNGSVAAATSESRAPSQRERGGHPGGAGGHQGQRSPGSGGSGPAGTHPGTATWHDPSCATGAFPPSYYVLTASEMAARNFPAVELGQDGKTLTCPPGYVATQPAATGVSPLPMVAIDCEMCYTANGLELTRVSVVDAQGMVLYDELVVPASPITDYNTRYSGITKEMLEGVSRKLPDVQRDLLRLIKAETILVGHSLESDLAACQVSHSRCLDTSVVFAHPRGPPFRPALRALAERFLKRAVQNGEKGHDSVEDARTAMDLALLKIRKGPSFGDGQSLPGENLFSVLTERGRRCALIDNRKMLHRFAPGATSAIIATSDADAVTKAEAEVQKEYVDLLWVRLGELSERYAEAAKDPSVIAGRAATMAAALTCGTPGEAAPKSEKDAVDRKQSHPGVVKGWGFKRQQAEKDQPLEKQQKDSDDEGEQKAGDEQGAEGKEVQGLARVDPKVPPVEAEVEEAMVRADERVARLHGALLPNSVLIVVTGHGDTACVQKLQELKWKRLQAAQTGLPEWDTASEQVLAAFQSRAKSALVFATVKR